MIITDIKQIDQIVEDIVDNNKNERLSSLIKDYEYVKEHSDELKAIKLEVPELTENSISSIGEIINEAGRKNINGILLCIKVGPRILRMRVATIEQFEMYIDAFIEDGFIFRIGDKNNTIIIILGYTLEDSKGDTIIPTAECIETIKHNLGITSKIEKLVKSYNAKRDSWYPLSLNINQIMSMLKREHKYPESAKNVFVPWSDMLAYMHIKHKHLVFSDKLCPECGKQTVVFYYSSPIRSWKQLCGRAGFITLCPSCPKQLAFTLTKMN